MMSAVKRISGKSLYRRFFGPKRHFTQRELSFFLNVDFSQHVALVAVVENEQETIIGGGRYVLKVFGKSELPIRRTSDGHIVHVVLGLV